MFKRWSHVLFTYIEINEIMRPGDEITVLHSAEHAVLSSRVKITLFIGKNLIFYRYLYNIYI